MTGNTTSDNRPFPYHLEWAVVWRYILLRPSLETFRWLLSDPKANRHRAYRWVFAVGLLVSVPIYLRAHFMLMSNPDYARVFGEIYGRAIPAVFLLGSAFLTVLIRISSGLIWLSGRALGGQANYNATAYLIGAFTAPLLLMAGVMVFLPLPDTVIFAGWGLLALWHWVLTIPAIMTANQLNSIKAVVASLVPLLVGFVVVMLVVKALAPPA